MEHFPFESSFFGSGAIWMLLTFPAYWIYQWTVEGAPFHLWQRRAVSAVKVSHAVTQSLADAGSTLTAPAESPSPAGFTVDSFYSAATD